MTMKGFGGYGGIFIKSYRNYSCADRVGCTDSARGKKRVKEQEKRREL